MTDGSSPYNTRYIIALSFISALGGYLFGFDFAVISGALPFLKDKFNLNEYWEGFATASLALGAIAGCIAAGKIALHYLWLLHRAGISSLLHDSWQVLV
jgi:SP family xylose:H+ symportor-like MFS transporter